HHADSSRRKHECNHGHDRRKGRRSHEGETLMIIVTGANGAFGRAAATRLIERLPRGSLILTSRTPEKLADFAARGALVRAADFDDPASLRSAFAGGTKMLLISTAR